MIGIIDREKFDMNRGLSLPHAQSMKKSTRAPFLSEASRRYKAGHVYFSSIHPLSLFSSQTSSSSQPLPSGSLSFTLSVYFHGYLKLTVELASFSIHLSPGVQQPFW